MQTAAIRKGMLPWGPPRCNQNPSNQHCHPSTELCHRVLHTILAMTVFFVCSDLFSIAAHSLRRRANCVCSVQPELIQGAVMQPLPEPGEAEKSSCNTQGRRTCHTKKNITTDSWIEVSARAQAKETVRPDVLAACASLWRPAVSWR